MTIEQSTVVSSRIRLARNVQGMPFPHLLKDRVKARSIANLVYDSLVPLKEDMNIIYVDEASPDSLISYAENYLISKTLINHKDISSFITNSDGSISVMINEEDHIRQQYMGKGLCLKKLFEMAMDIDENYIGRKIAYSKDREFGYLTACPSNLGSGMRASVMLFLPALMKSGGMEYIKKEVLPSGFILRGAYGEGSKGEGYLYQISNEVTLGIREEEIISRLYDTVSLLTEAEANERFSLKERDMYSLSDSCMRAYGVLSNAVILPYDEFLSLISEVKLGVSLGFLTVKDMDILNDLIVAMREHTLVTWEEDEEIPPDKNKDIYRGACVRRAMKRYVFPTQK